MADDKVFSFKIVDDFDNIFDEKNNSHLSFRKIQWGENEPKYELRKWTIKADGTEQPLKGFSFLTEEGPNELARVLVNTGFGHTDEILQELSTRNDFKSALNGIVGEDSEFFTPGIKEEEYFDPEDDEDVY